MNINKPTKRQRIKAYKKRQTTFFDSQEMEEYYLRNAEKAGAKLPSYINACLKKMMEYENSHSV